MIANEKLTFLMHVKTHLIPHLFPGLIFSTHSGRQFQHRVKALATSNIDFVNMISLRGLGVKANAKTAIKMLARPTR